MNTGISPMTQNAENHEISELINHIHNINDRIDSAITELSIRINPITFEVKIQECDKQPFTPAQSELGNELRNVLTKLDSIFTSLVNLKDRIVL